jgi:NADPH2:quinone reductase
VKAIVVSEFGGPEQLRLVDVADPEPGAGQVRIAVHAAGTSPVDPSNRADGSWAGLKPPVILGYEVAGVIDRLGPGVTGLSVGDRVMAMTHFPDGAGGYAELAVVDAAAVARIGATISFVAAAGTPVAGGTALIVLRRLGLAAGDRLLVLGASGGVGLFLLQLAADQGIITIAVGREAMHERMLGVGAAACIDYTSEDVAARAVELAGGPVDAVADLVGGTILGTALAALRAGGAIAAIETPELDLDAVLDANLTFHGVLLQDDGDRTRQLASLLDSGVLHPVISQVLPLSEVARAHEILEQGHAGGKVILAVVADG